MCGIAGIFNLDQRPCDSRQVLRLTDPLVHRGPDGFGIHTDGCIGLGHRRLAILDLSDAGKQPMQFRGRYWITFNGEIYNFVELRRELQELGQQFRTDTDTEVLVAAYHQWGPDCLLKLNGMWAFALWDSDRRELFLSRDRFGIKPLFYLSDPRRFVFASELKAFLCLDGFTARENENETRQQLATGCDSSEQTLIVGVKSLRAGHNMLVSVAGLRSWRWWCTLDHLVHVPKPFGEQVEQFRGLFLDSCRLRLRSDVPIATCLSGGLDSSSILCSLAAMNKERTSDFHRAFVATFAGTVHDEQEYAEASIGKAGAEPRYRAMDPKALIDDLPQYAYDYDTIGGQGLLLPVWALYRELRRDGVVVSLDGLGADELFMGYERSLRFVLSNNESLWRSPLRTLDLARTVQAMQPNASLVRILSDSDPVLRRIRATARRFTRPFRPVPGPPPMSQSIWVNGTPMGEEDSDTYERERMYLLTPLSRRLYRDFHHEANWLLLQRYDRISMAHGIEVRLPFLDWRLVTFAFSLPDESKVGGGYTKRILREAMRGILPEKVRTRTSKIGFQAPIQQWMNGALGDWVYERSQRPQFLDNPLVEATAIRNYIAQQHTARNWTRTGAHIVWRHMQADLWREVFFGAKPRASSPTTDLTSSSR